MYSTYLFLLSLIAIALAAVACGEYPGVPRQLAGGAITGAAEIPSAAGTDAASSNPTSDSQVVTGGAVEIELRDFEIVPSDLTVSAGDITFTLVNGGRYTHDFRIQGEGLDEKSPRVAAGRTGEWKITLEPGVYNISCPISNHADRGMVGTLTVTP
ncbi:MAG: cupredoxin domain-containing protein [Anaerolineae bacterium]